MRRRFAAENAFTLVEALVVMGILGVLSSLVLVGVTRVKASAKATQCQNNHRQCALAALMFVGNNHKYLPAPCWDDLAKYTPHLFSACVSINGIGWYYNGWGSRGRFTEESLGLVEARPWPGGYPSMGLPEARILVPSDMLMFLDVVDKGMPPRMRNDEMLKHTNYPHHGAINVSYCDGHVGVLKRRELRAIPDHIKRKYNNDNLAHADTW